MKKINLSLALLLCLTIEFSCKKENKADNSGHLPPLNIVVPVELQNNEQTVLFVKATEAAINQWSDTFEDLMLDCAEYIDVPEEDLSTMDKLKLLKASGTLMANMGEFAVKMAEIENQSKVIENGLSEKELQAFASVYDAFELRIRQLNEKYKRYGKNAEKE